jgi:transposase-like protein
MQNSSRARKHWTAEEREKLLHSFRRSSLTHKKFALHSGVSVSTLYAWLRKETVKKESGRSVFVPVPNLLSPVPAAPAYRLQWPDGLSLEVRAGFSSEELAVLLQLFPAR